MGSRRGASHVALLLGLRAFRPRGALEGALVVARSSCRLPRRGSFSAARSRSALAGSRWRRTSSIWFGNAVAPRVGLDFGQSETIHILDGSGLEFDDRGTAALKGVPDERSLFAVRD
jgi:hypothetical protein